MYTIIIENISTHKHTALEVLYYIKPDTIIEWCVNDDGSTARWKVITCNKKA